MAGSQGGQHPPSSPLKSPTGLGIGDRHLIMMVKIRVSFKECIVLMRVLTVQKYKYVCSQQKITSYTLCDLLK